LHPWELDTEQPRITSHRRDRFVQYVNLRKTEAKLKRVLNAFQFISIGQYLTHIET
jgi:hypothetical protein